METCHVNLTSDFKTVNYTENIRSFTAKTLNKQIAAHKATWFDHYETHTATAGGKREEATRFVFDVEPVGGGSSGGGEVLNFMKHIFNNSMTTEQPKIEVTYSRVESSEKRD